MKAIDQIKQFNPCNEAVVWLEDKTPQEAWDTCHRGDWMLWLYAKMYPDDLKGLTLAKGHCANTVRHLMKNERSLKVVDSAIAFGEGRATREDLEAAYAAAYAAYATDAAGAAAYATDAAGASYAAAYAAYAADAAGAAADASYAAAYAAYAADAAGAAAAYAAYATDATDAAADAAYAANQKQTADICRKYLHPKTQKVF